VLVLIASAGLLASKSVSLLVGASLDRDQLARLRKILTADPAVESVGHLLTMRLGPDSVLLTAAVRFQRRLSLDEGLGEVEQAIGRLERAIKAPYHRCRASGPRMSFSTASSARSNCAEATMDR
jgi:divalent metal cation (Fe/Co/Zn/Cd) transporter